jgi:hypothetical protein
MNQTQLDKKIDQFLRKKLTEVELKEMGIKPRFNFDNTQFCQEVFTYHFR